MLHDVFGQQGIEVVAAQLGIAVAGKHFDNAFLDLHNGNIERAAPQVVNQQTLEVPLVCIIGERGRRGFVDNADDFKTSQLACLTGWPLDPAPDLVMFRG